MHRPLQTSLSNITANPEPWPILILQDPTTKSLLTFTNRICSGGISPPKKTIESLSNAAVISLPQWPETHETYNPSQTSAPGRGWNARSVETGSGQQVDLVDLPPDVGPNCQRPPSPPVPPPRRPRIEKRAIEALRQAEFLTAASK